MAPRLAIRSWASASAAYAAGAWRIGLLNILKGPYFAGYASDVLDAE